MQDLRITVGLVAVDGAGDHGQVRDVGVVPGLRQLVHPDKIVCLTTTEEWVETKVDLRNFFGKKSNEKNFSLRNQDEDTS